MKSKFIGSLPETVEIGQVIVVTGRLHTNAERVDINLASGRSFVGKIPLHLSWRRSENTIVRNTKDVEFGVEERHENRNHTSSDLAIDCGDDFELVFYVQESFYEISINGKPYCVYHHRLPVYEIRNVFIDRDVAFVRGISQRRISPCTFPERVFAIDYRLAFLQDFPMPPKRGNVIVITATPKGNWRGRFVISLRQGQAKQQALHISIRFAIGVVVRNSRNPSGTWGREERTGTFPFALHRQFRIAIGFGYTKFHIAVNGNHLTDFDFRNGDINSTVNALCIAGDRNLKVCVTGVDHMRDDSLNMVTLKQLSSLEN